MEKKKKRIGSNSSINLVLHCFIYNIQGGFLLYRQVPGPCTSRRPVHRRLRGAYEFCRWVSMTDGRNVRIEVATIHRSQGVLENAVPLHVDIFRN
jgi:hypothetical protein